MPAHLWGTIVPCADYAAVVAVIKRGTAKVDDLDGAVARHTPLHAAAGSGQAHATHTRT